MGAPNGKLNRDLKKPRTFKDRALYPPQEWLICWQPALWEQKCELQSLCAWHPAQHWQREGLAVSDHTWELPLVPRHIKVPGCFGHIWRTASRSENLVSGGWEHGENSEEDVRILRVMKVSNLCLWTELQKCTSVVFWQHFSMSHHSLKPKMCKTKHNTLSRACSSPCLSKHSTLHQWNRQNLEHHPWCLSFP